MNEMVDEHGFNITVMSMTFYTPMCPSSPPNIRWKGKEQDLKEGANRPYCH